MVVRIHKLSIMFAIFLLALKVHHAVAIFHSRHDISDPVGLKVDRKSCSSSEFGEQLFVGAVRDVGLIGKAGSDAIEQWLQNRALMHDDERRRIEMPLKTLFGETTLSSQALIEIRGM